MKTIYSNLAVVSTLLLIVAPFVIANVEPTCGEPEYNKRKDRAVFLWRACFSNQWYVQASGGKLPVAVNGTLVADTSDIAISKKAVGVELNKNFTINIAKKKKDGFKFLLKDEGSGCLNIKTPEDIPLYVGKNRVEHATKSISVPGLRPCDGPILEYRFDTSRTLFKDTGANGWDGSTAPGRDRLGHTELGRSGFGASFVGRGVQMVIREAKDLSMDKYTMMAWVRYSQTSFGTIGACCFPDFPGICGIASESECLEAGGKFQGHRTECFDDACPTDTTPAPKTELASVIALKTSAIWLTINEDTRTVRFGGFFGGCARKNRTLLKGSRPILTETWTHIAATNDGNSLKVYINGELDSEIELVTKGTFCSNKAPLNIGSYLGETRAEDRNFFRGYMDTFRVYNKNLSHDEIRSEMFRH